MNILKISAISGIVICLSAIGAAFTTDIAPMQTYSF